jgi:hypothetical protein
VSGAGSGYNNPAGRGEIIFRSTRALDANRRYHVVLKGDPDLDSLRGVLSSQGIGMLGPHNETFNGLAYDNSFIWSFETGEAICALDQVVINPESHLFYALDQIQQFAAEPRTRNNEILNSIAEYSWEWSWRSDNENISTITNSNNPIQTAAPLNHRDAKTYITASARITVDSVLDPPTVGRVVSGRAAVYVFLCENPWPPRNPDGSWLPWYDPAVCTVNPANCDIYNYGIYYCRDNGGNGTFDDLPAILNRDTIIRGGTGDILKEAYFFRQTVPGGAANLAAAPNPDGTSIALSWSAVAGASGYKVYWGTASGNYTGNADAGNSTSYTITGLDTGRTYYVNLTSYGIDLAESDLYGEIEAALRDTEDPDPPVLSGNPGNREAVLFWEEVEEDAAYEVLYGVNSGGPYGYSENLGRENAVAISGLTNGQTYYFVVRTIDRSGNISIYSNEVSLTPSE